MCAVVFVSVVMPMVVIVMINVTVLASFTADQELARVGSHPDF